VPTPPPALAGLRFSVAGPGRVGASLAHWAAAAGARAVFVAGRTRGGAAAELAGALGAAPRSLVGLATGGQDLLLLALPDAALAGAARRLALRPQARVVLHCSGSAGAELLAPLAAAGSAVGTLHPLKAFPTALPDPREARGVCFALDGERPATALARRLVAAWGGVGARVPGAARSAYHLGASLAAGGTVTLLAAATELARRLGLPAAVGRGYAELARGALARAAAAPRPAQGITGPVERGEAERVLSQLEALRGLYPELVPLVIELGLESLRRLAAERPLGRGHARLRRALASRAGEPRPGGDRDA
jgi:predicted short-subunit dehydrogenase-like oxidoreductase (DUF2520 family)